MKYIFILLFGLNAEAAESRFQVLADAASMINGGYGIDVSYLGLHPFAMGFLTSQRNIDGYERTEKPNGMHAVHFRYHFRPGFYLGAAFTYVTLIREEDGQNFDRTGKLVLAGYELRRTRLAFRAGLGYGDGAPYIGMYENRFFGGLFDYTYLDLGVGIQF